MSDDSMLVIDDSLSIPRAELSYRASRSGGPGGQHVNTSSTRIELLWDVGASPSIDDAQRDRIMQKLANRIDAAGVLQMASSDSRSQHQNREAVTERFAKVVAAALRVPKKRRPTRPSRASKEAGLRAKRERAETKRRRGPVAPDE
jgi:ribosome-associated protein